MVSFNEILNELHILEEKNFFKVDKNNPDDLEEFVTKRAAGAKKISNQAKNKGGYSLLTAVHFDAKKTPYTQASKHVNDKDSVFIKKKADACFEKLKNWDKMSQREFQWVMGQLEAYGEVYIRSLEEKGK
jgi:hypothetical protein